MGDGMMSIAPRVVALFLLGCVWALPSLASDSIEIPCTGAPDDAQLKLPGPVYEWMRVACTRYGHVLTSARDWQWLKSTEEEDIQLPADMVNGHKLRLAKHAAYFTEFHISKLGHDEVKERLKAFPEWAVPSTLDAFRFVYAVEAVTNSGRSMMVYSFMNKSDGLALICAPECGTYLPIVLKR